MANVWDILKSGAAGIGTGLLTGNPLAGVQAGLGVYSGIRDRSDPNVQAAIQAQQQQLARLGGYADQANAYNQQQQGLLSGAQGDLSGAVRNYQGQVGQFQNQAGGFGQSVDQYGHAVGGFQGQVGQFQGQIPGFQQAFNPQGQNVLDPTQTGLYQQLQGQYNTTDPGNFLPPSVRSALFQNAINPVREQYDLQQAQALESANATNTLGSGSLGVRQGLLDRAFQRSSEEISNNITAQDFQAGLQQQQGLRQALLGLQGQAYDRSMGLENLRIGGAQLGLGAAQQGLAAGQQGLGASESLLGANSQGLQAAQLGLNAGQSGLGAQQQLYGTYQQNAQNAQNQFGQAQQAYGNAAQGLYGMGRQQQGDSDARFQAVGNAISGAAQTAYMPQYLKSVSNALNGSRGGFTSPSAGYSPASKAASAGRYFAGSTGPR